MPESETRTQSLPQSAPPGSLVASSSALPALVVQILVDETFHVHPAAREHAFEIDRTQPYGVTTIGAPDHGILRLLAHGHLLLLLTVQLRDVLLHCQVCLLAPFLLGYLLWI